MTRRDFSGSNLTSGILLEETQAMVTKVFRCNNNSDIFSKVALIHASLIAEVNEWGLQCMEA